MYKFILFYINVTSLIFGSFESNTKICSFTYSVVRTIIFQEFVYRDVTSFLFPITIIYGIEEYRYCTKKKKITSKPYTSSIHINCRPLYFLVALFKYMETPSSSWSKDLQAKKQVEQFMEDRSNSSDTCRPY